jgi:hypothetical protein
LLGRATKRKAKSPRGRNGERAAHKIQICRRAKRSRQLTRPRVALDARLTRQMSVGMQTYVRELVARLPEAAPDLQFVVVSNADLEVAGAKQPRGC